MRRLIAAAVLLAAAAAVPALAADPSSGKVSLAAPTIKWTGQSYGFPVGIVSILEDAAGQAPTCVAPTCDTFELEVADVADLTVSVIAESLTQLSVIKPDGSYQWLQGPGNGEATTLKFKRAAVGTWQIRTVVNSIAGVAPPDYTGTATLGSTAAAKPAPAGTPAPAPAPGATPAPATAPAPAPGASITIKAPKLSAKKLKKVKKFVATVTSSKPVTNVVATLRAGKKVVATGKLASLSGTAKLTLKTKGKLKAGKYTLLVQAKDGAAGVGASAPVKVGK